MPSIDNWTMYWSILNSASIYSLKNLMVVGVLQGRDAT